MITAQACSRFLARVFAAVRPIALCAIAACYAPTILAVPSANGQSHLADLERFLDKATPTAQRATIFAAWREAALQGDADAQYVVGSIYRRGDDVDPHVVERDSDQARRNLSTAAAHGRVLAMAKMAELELTQDRPHEAMIWAQLYGYYCGWAGAERPVDYAKHRELQPTLYYEDLLRRVAARVSQKLGEPETELVVQQVNAFVAAHDKDITAQIWRDGISPLWAGRTVKVENAKAFRRINLESRAMVSEWLLDFATDGSVKKATPLDALPDFAVANHHHAIVAQLETDPSRVDADRYALKTMHLKRNDDYFSPKVTH